MDVNLLPEDDRPGRARRLRIGLSLENVRRADFPVWLRRTIENGFGGVEIGATGEPWSMHAPAVSSDERADLRQALGSELSLAVVAPTQSTFDITLVSPSAAIRRASVTELWSVCRLAGSLISGEQGDSAVVIVRTGVAPVGTGRDREAGFLSECLVTLDRMAGEHNARIALLNADFFQDLNRFPVLLGHLSLKNTGIALDARAALDHGISADDVARFARKNADMLSHVRVPDKIIAALVPVAAALGDIEYAGMTCITPSTQNLNYDQAAHIRNWWISAICGTAEAAADREDASG